MAAKKSKLDKATDVVGKMLAEQLSRLPAGIAAEKRKKRHQLGGQSFARFNIR
jgi:hypothetical protein